MVIDRPYWLEDQPQDDIRRIIGAVPKRWGRMDGSSRIALVEIGALLYKAGLLDENHQLPSHTVAGLVVGSRRGSIDTDRRFNAGLRQSPETASPLLFSYTLPNIPLSEAACHYQLRGPVYTLYAERALHEAKAEGERWLRQDPSISFMVCGELDFKHTDRKQPEIIANFTITRP